MKFLDQLLDEIGHSLQTNFPQADTAEELLHPNDPAQGKADPATEEGRDLAMDWMRINHVGEICAQALYRGHALTAREQGDRERMAQAAREEETHLRWCRQRILALGGRPSALAPGFYGLSFAMGMAAGALSSSRGLGFVAETEYQVRDHLDDVLRHLPADAEADRAVVERIRADETEHAEGAMGAGGRRPGPVGAWLMRAASEIMKRAVTSTQSYGQLRKTGKRLSGQNA